MKSENKEILVAARATASMVVRALRRDAEEGRPIRGELADDFEKSWNEIFQLIEDIDNGTDL